jgi:hypothetical protein
MEDALSGLLRQLKLTRNDIKNKKRFEMTEKN